MDILFSNLLSESSLDFGKWSNWKHTNTRICVFSVHAGSSNQTVPTNPLPYSDVFCIHSMYSVFIAKIFLDYTFNYVWLYTACFPGYFVGKKGLDQYLYTYFTYYRSGASAILQTSCHWCSPPRRVQYIIHFFKWCFWFLLFKYLSFYQLYFVRQIQFFPEQTPKSRY